MGHRFFGNPTPQPLQPSLGHGTHVFTLNEAAPGQSPFGREDSYVPPYFALRSGQRNGHDQLSRTLVEKINGNDQGRPSPGLFMADGGIETEVPDVTP